jgi:arginine N-succinyltransferase
VLRLRARRFGIGPGRRHRGDRGRRGLAEPWYNYRVGTIVHASRALEVYTVAPTLFLANDHTGHTELCSLFLDQAHRHGRNGPLLAKSRLLFIAEFTDRFAPKVIAELRGKLDADGRSPFLGGPRAAFLRDGIFDRRLPHRNRPEVVRRGVDAALSGVREPAARLRPRRHRRSARRHARRPDAAGAGRLPLRGYVDIFDAGPTVECFATTFARSGEARCCRC